MCRKKGWSERPDDLCDLPYVCGNLCLRMSCHYKKESWRGCTILYFVNIVILVANLFNMNKIINYRALSSNDTLDLTESVNHWIARGYQPVGSISCSVAISDDGVCNVCVYAQTMVEYGDD